MIKVNIYPIRVAFCNISRAFALIFLLLLPMRHRIFLTLFLLAVVQLPAQSQIINLLNENFNSGFPAGWINSDEDVCTPAPAVNLITGDAFKTHVDYDTLTGGDSILVATSWFQPACQASNYLVLPALTLQANGNLFQFQFKSKDPSYPEAFEVLLSTTGTAWVDFSDTLFSTDLANPNWVNASIDLDAFAGQTVYLAIHHSSYDKFILCLDNFKVFADLQLSVTEIVDTQVKLFPNPASDLLSIQSTAGVESVFIYDAAGKLLMSTESNSSGFVSLTVSQLPAGFYFARVNTTNGSITRQFIRH